MAGRGEIVAGVDLGGTKIQTVIADGAETIGRARGPTPSGGAEAVAGAVVDGVRTALGEAGVPIEALASVGIGAPGRVVGGVVSHGPNIPGLQDPFPLGSEVSRALGDVRVQVGNDVTVATLGEFRRGAGRPFRSLLGVFVGTGVGGGLIVDGAPWEGRGAAGEIGHVIVKPEGRRCGCGGRGHLEAYAGRAGMEAKARRLVAAGKRTVLFDLMAERGRDRMTSGTIARALQLGDEMAATLIDEAIWASGVALATAQNLLDVEALVVGGGLTERFGDPFVERIAGEMRSRLFVADHPPAVLASELGDLAGALGAVVLAGG
jgi:glucokinase